MTPVLIVTRPDPQGAEFAEAIQKAWDGPLQIILSPLLQIVPVAVADDLSGVAGVIFTSANGVAQAARLGIPYGIPAYCVGERTATAAKKAGFDTITGQGDAAQLTKLILSQRPEGPLAHVRGKHALGDIATALGDADLLCHDVVAYDQVTLELTEAAKKAAQSTIPVVVPLFSPRTCTIFEESGPYLAPMYIVAISTAALPATLKVETKLIAPVPTGQAMIDETLRCLRDIA